MGGIEPLEPRIVLAGDLLISELMAANGSGLNDVDGQTSDWVEILNTSNNVVDLDGWYLTDDAQDLTKWQFPHEQLAAGQSTIVFASGKDRAVADAELHTNFRLSRGGEFLALVEPDGTTISDQYDPYPQQYVDVSYGPQQEVVPTELVVPGADARVLLPSSAGEDVAAADWTAIGFDDSGWQAAKLGVGYDLDAEDGDFSPLIGAGGEVSSMVGNTASAYVRTTFQVEGDQVPDYNTLTLGMNYDDGYVAYLNGKEVARTNAPDTPAWDSVATQEHGGVAEIREYSNFNDVDDQDDFMLVGDAKWLFGRLALTASQTDQNAAAWTREAIPFGSDYSFSTSMAIDVYSRGGGGGEGMTFVLQSGGNTRLGDGGGDLSLVNTGMDFVAIEFDSDRNGAFDTGPTMRTHIGIDTSAVGSVARAEVERFNGGNVGQNIRYVWVDYNGLTDQMDVYFTDTTTKPDTPTLSAEVDLEALFGGTPSLWAGWTATTSTKTNSHDVLQWQFTSGAGQLGLEPAEVDISEHLDLLQPGQNVLAVHALNIDPGDEDLLALPTLTATETILSERAYFSDPTPGEINGAGGDPPAGIVTISVGTKVFVDPFTVEITAPSPTAQIRYTTDGAIPDDTSTLYTGPIEITETSRIRARAFEEGRAPGEITSEGYIQLDESVADYENGQPYQSNLPVMVFESYRGRADSQSTRLAPVTAIFISPDEDGYASIFDEPEFTGRAGLRTRGQTSQGWPKKPYALEIWEEGNSDERPIPASEAEDRSIPVFGLPPESDWVLNNPYSDKTQLNNYLSFHWSNEMGLYAPRTRLVEVFVNDNGGTLDMRRDYRGTYVLMEKIKRDENRVDITPMTPSDNSEPEITGGYIWKKDKDGAGDRNFRTSRGQGLKMVEPKPADVTDEQVDWLTNYINQFEAALYGPDFKDPDVGYAKYIDVDSWIDTWILVEMTKQIDGFRLSTYYHKDRGGKIKQGPPWDFNLSLVNANYLKGAYPEGWYKDAGLSTDQYPYWDRLFEDPNFQQRLVDRWQQLRQTIFTTDNMMADIDAAVRLISDGNPNYEHPAEGEPSNPIARNVARWGERYFTTYHWPNCYFGQGDCPRTSPLESADNPRGRPQSYADYIYLMKDFVERRFEWIDQQFLAPPTFSHESGAIAAPIDVTMQTERGTIIYTTDGSDPRDFVAGARDDVFLQEGSQADILVPTILDPFAPTLVSSCTGAPLANPDQCLISPNYSPGTHGESWITGPLAVGFDNRDSFTSLIQTDIQASMDNLNPAAYIRIPFELTAEQIDGAAALTLQMRYDDGFVAYLWSDQNNLPVEIARANAPGEETSPITPLAFNAQASRSHRNSQAVDFQDFDVTDALPLLREGTNYLVIHGLNQAITSHDFLMDARMVAKRKLADLPEGIFEYSGPVTVDKNTHIVARAFDQLAEEWSGPVSVSYVLDQPRLVVSELNYNPYDPTPEEEAAGFTNADDFEFIELQNVGTNTPDLIASRFTDGVDFQFPSVQLAPGQRAVLVKNLAAFQTRYGADIPVVGQYGGNLNNNGEGLTLVGPTGDVLLDFVFGDSALWPRSADGFGASLQLIDAATVPADQLGKPYRWRGSTELGGSPGAEGAAPLGVAINEVLSNPGANQSDAIELLNVTAAPIDVSGWYLSDSGTQPLKYQLPAGSIIGPGQYLVINESQINPNPAKPGENDFALSGSRGDAVWLTLPGAGGQIGSFADDVQFGAAVEGESFGRVPDGSGRLAPMTAVTLGSANAAPRVGPVVISEVNYSPGPPSQAALAIDPALTSADLEFVEIHNPTADALNLNNWRIRGGVDFEFGVGTSLAPNESLVVTPFDPADPANASRLEAFRAEYGLGQGVAIVGGYQGQLSNNTERVQLQRPGARGQGELLIPRLLEDEVIYDDVAPWPEEADGQGPSLTRANLTGWGNDASNWVAGNPTPGSMEAFVPEAGDSNGDRQFDQQDIVMVLQGGKYLTGQPATFAEGDWNHDGVFNQLDLVAALQTGNYLQGPYAATSEGGFASLRAAAPEADAVDQALGDDLAVDDLLSAL